MDEITQEQGALVERVAALDIGKAVLTACVRVPHEGKPGARRQEVRLCHGDPGAAGPAGLADLPGRDPDGDGGHLGLLEAAAACWKTPSPARWSTPAMSRTCPDAPKPTC
jgi:hypothetical protein